MRRFMWSLRRGSNALWLALVAGAAAVALVALAASPAAAQEQALSCRDLDGGGSRARACVMREIKLPRRASLAVDGRENGGIRVEAWDGDGILVRARVQARADTRQAAQKTVDAVRVETAGTIHATGPDRWLGGHGWSVSYEIRVPRATDLDLETHNGGIRITGVKGQIAFDAVNGGVHLADVAGDVHGRTTNGGLYVRLEGRRWDGTGLDARTTNGGVHLQLPADYAAHLETHTRNGGMRIDFPITVSGRIGRTLETDLNGGGPPIRLRTTNGGVTIEHG